MKNIAVARNYPKPKTCHSASSWDHLCTCFRRRRRGHCKGHAHYHFSHVALYKGGSQHILCHHEEGLWPGKTIECGWYNISISSSFCVEWKEQMCTWHALQWHKLHVALSGHQGKNYNHCGRYIFESSLQLQGKLLIDLGFWLFGPQSHPCVCAAHVTQSLLTNMVIFVYPH